MFLERRKATQGRGNERRENETVGSEPLALCLLLGGWIYHGIFGVCILLEMGQKEALGSGAGHQRVVSEHLEVDRRVEWEEESANDSGLSVYYHCDVAAPLEKEIASGWGEDEVGDGFSSVSEIVGASPGPSLGDSDPHA